MEKNEPNLGLAVSVQIVLENTEGLPKGSPQSIVTLFHQAWVQITGEGAWGA